MDATKVINIEKEVDAWAGIAIERLQKELRKKKIGVTDNLYRSFEKQVQKSGGDVQAVMIKFAMYGRFRDMGVGNGMKAYERKSNKANLVASKQYGSNVTYTRRQAKRWFNKPKMAQIYRLREILSATIGNALVANLAGDIGQTEYKVKI